MSDVVAEAIRERLELLTLAQVCDLLGVSRSWVYDQVESGRIPVIRLGRQLRFRASTIDAWLIDSADTRSAPVAPLPPSRRRGRPRKG